MILNKHSVKEVFFYLFLLFFNVVGLVGLFHKQCVHTPSGVEVCTRVGGGCPQNFKYIYNYFNVFKIKSTKVRVGSPHIFELVQ